MKITMKKSILLNEDEKSRILNLHETAKNLYENKKPVSSIKEDKSKKENMKKVIKLTESDLEKIVRRVIEEQYMGVAFGGEQNGLQIKKMETKEQVQGTPANQGNVAATQPKTVDQSILSKIKTSFPAPMKDATTGVLSFNRSVDSPKYDMLVKFLANTNYGRSIGVMDISNVKDMATVTKGTKSNDMAMKALYDGAVSILTNGYSNALKDLTKYGGNGENIKIISGDYLDKLGIKYS
jgi:hypothetical protein